MLTISIASQKDIEAINRIAQESLPRTYNNIMSTEQIDYLQDLHFSSQAIDHQLSEGQIFFVAKYEDGNTVGFASIIQEGPELYRMLKIYVSPNLMERGIGSSLFKYAVNYIKEKHTDKKIKLELLVSPHNQSLPFYSKMGMKQVGEKQITIIKDFELLQLVFELDVA